MSVRSYVEYRPSTPRWLAFEYRKTEAQATATNLSKIPVHWATGSRWASEEGVNVGTGRLSVLGINDFSSGAEDAVWVIAIPLNSAAGSLAVATQETLIEWQDRFDAVRSLNESYPFFIEE